MEESERVKRKQKERAGVLVRWGSSPSGCKIMAVKGGVRVGKTVSEGGIAIKINLIGKMVGVAGASHTPRLDWNRLGRGIIEFLMEISTKRTCSLPALHRPVQEA